MNIFFVGNGKSGLFIPHLNSERLIIKKPEY